MQKLINLGCKLNQYEGFCLIEKFHHIKNLVIVNTCCVTKEAEIKSLKKFKQAIKKYPDSTVIATGCACRLHPEKFSAAQKVIDNVERVHIIHGVLPKPEKSRYFLKIQNGCNGNCTFCIVSKVREKIETKTLEEIKKEIFWVISLGYKEIVIVGANIGLYGIDIGINLFDLLKTISKISGLPRIRLSSIEPRFMNQELIEALKDIPFCRHFHIAVQSGDNHILSKMGRDYDVSDLKNLIDLIRKNFNDVAIGADLIVGFPEEGEEEFLNTYDFIKSNPFTHIHVFPYSPRPLTKAYELGDPVPYQTKKKRLWQLKNLVADKNYQFRKGLIGKTLDVIVEGNAIKLLTGLTDNYIRVRINGSVSKNELVKVNIKDVSRDFTYGTVV